MSNWRAWVIVGRGLELKLAGLVLFAGLPLLSALLWSSESDPRWLLLGVGLAAAPYFVGRCLCLAAPPQVRLSVILSVVFQVFAFVALAGFGYTGGVLEVGFESTPLALKELEAGGVDAVVADNGVVINYVTNNSGGKFKTVSDPVFQPEQYGLAVKKGNAELLAKLNKGLADIKADGSYAQIFAKYFGAAAAVPASAASR